MAVVISNGATNLSTASGFYRVEAYNLASFSSTDLALTTSRQINVTFANAGNSQGLVITLVPQSIAAASTFKDVVVTLQEDVATVWTDRASATLTGTQIANAIAGDAFCDGFITPFTFGTPYAVDTVAAKWRFNIAHGSGTNNWSIRTSNATAPFYAAWCNNAVTFTSGDTLICKDPVTVNATTTVGSLLGTGDTTNGVAIIVCKSTSAPTVANSAGNLLWSTAASYTLSVGGVIVLGAHSCFRIGTSGARQSYTNQAHIQFTAPTVGSVPGAICSTEGPNTNGSKSKMSVIFYGEYPAVEDCELNADTTVSGTTFTSATNASSWLSGWRVGVSKQNLKGAGDTAIYTLNGAPSWSGSQTTFTTTAGLATNVRKSGGKIVTLDGYGIKITSSNLTYRWRLILAHPSNWVFSGVQQEEMQPGDNATGNNTSNAYSTDDAANRSQFVFEHCSMYGTTSTNYHGTTTAPPEGLLIDHVNGIRCIPFLSPLYQSVPNGPITYTNCIHQSTPGMFTPILLNTDSTTSGNVWENSASTFLMGSAMAIGATFTNNKFWGNSASIGLQVQAMVNCTISGNTFNQMTNAVSFAGTVLNCIDTNSQFGNEASNTTDVAFLAASGQVSIPLLDYEFNSPTGNLNVPTTNQTGIVTGSMLRISDFNDTSNDDRNWFRYGFMVKTGTGLSDTTVRTAGGYAWRFQPNHATGLLTWPALASQRAVPTGNIQNKTMTVTAWVYINNTAYDAGTYTFPTLNVKYDNTTTTTAVATATFGSWQRLSVTFTPTTSYGSVEVWFTSATDATTTNAYWYLDDVSINYPAGVNISLGSLDLSAHAQPVWPPINTVLADAASVWDAQTSGHQISGSTGEALTSGGAPTAAQVADAVWDEVTSGHATAGTTGKALTDAASGAGLSVAGIADAVWDEAQSGHTTAGSFGYNLDSPVSGVGWSSGGGSTVINKGLTEKQLAELIAKIRAAVKEELENVEKLDIPDHSEALKELLTAIDNIPVTDIQPVLESISNIKIPEVKIPEVIIPEPKDYTEKLEQVENLIASIPSKIVIPTVDLQPLQDKIDSLSTMTSSLDAICSLIEEKHGDIVSSMDQVKANQTKEILDELNSKLKTVLKYLVNLKYDNDQMRIDSMDSKYEILEEVIK